MSQAQSPKGKSLPVRKSGAIADRDLQAAFWMSQNRVISIIFRQSFAKEYEFVAESVKNLLVLRKGIFPRPKILIGWSSRFSARGSWREFFSKLFSFCTRNRSNQNRRWRRSRMHSAHGIPEGHALVRIAFLLSGLLICDFQRGPISNLLEPLHIMHTGNFSHTLNDAFQMLQVGDVEDDIHIRLAVGSAGFDIADVGFAVADDGGDLF